MKWIPRCKHGPFCTGGPMHIPLAPTNAFERWLIKRFPPLTHEQSREVYAAHIRAVDYAALMRAVASEAPKKACYVGAPSIFALEQCCRQINDAFDGYGCYLVGSALERPDWRDVDVRFIMSDEDFRKLFPDAAWSVEAGATWEFDSRWLLLTIAISEHLSKVTGLPVDFQFQPQSFANAKHNKKRNALGLRYRSLRSSEEPQP